jgi:hypothetical protein
MPAADRRELGHRARTAEQTLADVHTLFVQTGRLPLDTIPLRELSSLEVT